MIFVGSAERIAVDFSKKLCITLARSCGAGNGRTWSECSDAEDDSPKSSIKVMIYDSSSCQQSLSIDVTCNVSGFTVCHLILRLASPDLMECTRAYRVLHVLFIIKSICSIRLVYSRCQEGDSLRKIAMWRGFGDSCNTIQHAGPCDGAIVILQ